MTAHSDAITLIARGVVPYLIAEHGNVQMVIEEFLGDLEIDVH